MLGFAPRPWISSIDGTFSWAMFDLFGWLYNWLVVFATPLEKKKSSVGMMKFPILMEKSSSHVPVPTNQIRICEGFAGDFLGFIDIHR